MKKHGNNNFNRIFKYFRIRAEVLISGIIPIRELVMPDFICIGAPRAATTWFHSRLSIHPDIFLPKIKELHYFDEPHSYETNNNTRIQWQRSFYFDLDKNSSWKWYSRKFKNGYSKIKGDITPAYSILSTERILEIYNYLPNLKIIYIIRDPVERAWSGIRRTLWNDIGIHPSKYDSLLSIATHPEILMRGEYESNIKRWESVFKKPNFLYLFYDDIATNPKEQIDKVCEFIGVKPYLFPTEKNIGERVNMAPSEKMPKNIRDKLLDYYKNERVYLEDRFGINLKEWNQ